MMTKRNSPFINGHSIFALLAPLCVLVGCSAGSGDNPVNSSASPELTDSYAVMGPVSGASIAITDISGATIATGNTEMLDSDRDLVTVDGKKRFKSYADGRRVGQILIDPAKPVNLGKNALYIIKATGGVDTDPDDNGIVADSEGLAGPRLTGSIFALVSGAELISGQVRVNILTTLAFAATKSTTDSRLIKERADRLAAYWLKSDTAQGDINGDGVLSFADFASYDPSDVDYTPTSPERKQDRHLRNATLFYAELNRNGSDGKNLLQRLRAGGGVSDINNFMVSQFGDADKDGLADIFEDPAQHDSDLDGIFDAVDSDDDGDGLSDTLELALGLNPWSKDSDGDTTTDANEDSDGDGLSNTSEISTHMTDAALADTDSDGIKDGLEITLGLNPKDASDGTADKDGDGLTNTDEVNIHKTDPAKPDTDGDGLTDGDEVNTYQSDPLKLDTDGDTLEDGNEVNTHRTQPARSDTDGDGISDGDEVKGFLLFDGTTRAFTDPLSTDSDLDGIHDGIERQVQVTFSRYFRPLSAQAFLLGPLHPNKTSDRPNLGGLSFTDVQMTQAALEADPDFDGKPTIEELFHQTNPNSAASSFAYAYETSPGGLVKAEFSAMQNAHFIYVPGGWDVDEDGNSDSGFFVSKYAARDTGTPVDTTLAVRDLVPAAQVYNSTTRNFKDRLCQFSDVASDSTTSDADGACRGHQYGNSGVSSFGPSSINRIQFAPQGVLLRGTSWLEAVAAVSSSAVDRDGAQGGPYPIQLPSERQWMQIVQTIVNSPINWTSNTLGTGLVFRGHSDGTPTQPLSIVDPAQSYDGTGNSAANGPEQKRTHRLNNCAVARDFTLPCTHSVEIWDFSGNELEWTRGLIAAVGATSTSQARDGGDRFLNGLGGSIQYNGTNTSGSTVNITTMPNWWKPQIKDNVFLTRLLGGGIYNDGPTISDVNGDGRSDGAFSSFDVGYGSGNFVDHYAAVLRGGDLNSASSAGVAAADVFHGISRKLPTAGFRATR